jgi:histidinol-phosphatase (PHP family)
MSIIRPDYRLRKIMKNYHTHTYRCKHASGDVIEYAGEAVRAGLDTLGMSDHCPLPDDRWSHIRMPIEELEDYERAIEVARQAYPELTIVKGLECEWVPELRNYYEDVFLRDNRFSYLIGGIHWFLVEDEWLDINRFTPSTLVRFAEFTIEAMESGLFLFLAHPDNFGSGYPDWDENARSCALDILEAAERLQIPLEINGYGLRKSMIETTTGEKRRKYPWIPFWECAAEYDISVVCNSDAHKPADVGRSIDECIAIAEYYNLRQADLSSDLALQTSIPFV